MESTNLPKAAKTLRASGKWSFQEDRSMDCGIIGPTKNRNAPAVPDVPRGATPQIGAVTHVYSIPPTTEETIEYVPEDRSSVAFCGEDGDA